MLINIILAIIAYKTKSLTFKGTILALILGTIVYYLCLEAYIVLLFYFLLIITIEKFVLKSKREKRNSWQVLSNFIFAFISLIMLFCIGKHRYFVLYCSMISVSLCDTLASTLGTRYAKNVYSILKLKKCDKGVSGGISFCGCISGALGSAIISFMYYLLSFRNSTIPIISDILLIFLLGVFGMIIDSVLGDLAQKKYYCVDCKKETDNEICCGKNSIPVGKQLLTNSQVNIISEGVVFIIGLLII